LYLNDIYVLSTDSRFFGWYQIVIAGNQPLGRSGHSAVLIEGQQNNQLLIFGGLTEMWSLQFIPDPDKPPSKWTFQWLAVDQIGEIPTARMFHSAISNQQGGLIYLVGGTVDGVNPIPGLNLYIFNIASKTWTKKTPYASQHDILSSGIWGQAAVMVDQDSFLMLGGYLAGFSNQIIQYYAPNNTMLVVDGAAISQGNGLIPSPRRSSTAVLFPENQYLSRKCVIQFGGVSDAVSGETDILTVKTSNENPPSLQWIISFVSSVEVVKSSGAAVINIEGIGFQSARSDKYNSVTIFPLANPSDPVSAIDQSKPGVDCLLKTSDFHLITCIVEGLLPNGYSAVVVETLDSHSGQSVASAEFTALVRSNEIAHSGTSLKISPSSMPSVTSPGLPPSGGAADSTPATLNIPINILIPSALGLIVISFIIGILVAAKVQRLRKFSANKQGKTPGTGEKYLVAISEETLNNA
jgi:hypothetical protein